MEQVVDLQGIECSACVSVYYLRNGRSENAANWELEWAAASGTHLLLPARVGLVGIPQYCRLFALQ